MKISHFGISSLTAMTLSMAAVMPFQANAQSAMDQQFATLPTYAGDDLGVTVHDGVTSFKLWSPQAQEVKLNIYPTGRNSVPDMTIGMLKGDNGVWTASVPESLYGKFYTYNIYQDGRWRGETPGVWAKSAGPNGKRAAIIDFSQTDPEGWAADKGPETKSPVDAVVYEMHHRDMSIHPSSGIANKGKFLALTEHGTTTPTGEKTGIDHLKELGITHVQILPSYDYGSVDETNLPSNQYNWGYDPQNYNVPEGSYSTNPSDPTARVREMKEMVKALHDAGIGVIMDVVYNHTFINEGSNFDLTAPGYYYRHRQDGSWSDASGCGNETASERQQMRNFMLNSLKHWVKEYHIDGFRFDLMAIHDIETMNEIVAELRKINPDIIIYGEGWTAGDSPLAADKRALKDNVYMMPGVGVFSDDIRDAVKGHYSRQDDRGFATGKPGNEETVKIGIVGATDHPQVDYSKGNNSKKPYALSPAQVVNYVSCHDDLTLTDKLNKSMGDTTSVAKRQRAAKLAQTIVLTSQGIPFIWCGEEIFRDKKGDHNSFQSPDSINAIDWNNKHLYPELFDYYRNLIALRKAHPAFRMSDAKEVARNIKFDRVNEPNLISYSILNNANGDRWREIKLVFNGSEATQTVNIPKGNWTVIARDEQINPDGLGTAKGGKMEVAPVSALILARD